MRQLRTFPSAAGRVLRAGFTLIEMMAVLLIIGILMYFLLPTVTDSIAQSKVVACQANLRNIYTGIQAYEMKYKHLPDRSGVQFFAMLITRGAWENTKTNAQRLTCPAVDTNGLPGLMGKDEDQWFIDIEAVDGSYSSYAGRDLKANPLRRLSGKEPLVCDDNDASEGNHPTTTNVLMGDGSIDSLEIKLFEEKGEIPKDSTRLAVGPDAEVEVLRKFTLN
ncbi:MAG: prepilin-type N-terminal cleavage/methylation domain-containing protein [Planctomycetes bacterium]|nr:prepilin-type N-terminal cleavage/methylation domain-containing protein [Planctomycetota bacterium]